jgi:endonuclease YncB( thermonuclease family)
MYSTQMYVVKVLDGDTIRVTNGNPNDTPVDVRFAGINTNEYPEMCHAGTAKARLAKLIEGKWVTLLAEDPDSKAFDGVRYLRFVERNGVDLNLKMLEEGYALAMPSNREPSRNRKYMAAARSASHEGKRLWNDDACGAGPSAGAELRMFVHWDAEGTDGEPGTLNGEWVRIFNDSGFAVSLGGWTLRTTSTRAIWDMPSNASIPANDSITVYVGSGTNTATKLYMGYDRALFGNSIGDGAYLLDPDDDIRTYFEYPCIGECWDPLQGKVHLSVNADAVGSDGSNPNGEWVNLTNVSSESVNLNGYQLRNGGKLYDFPEDSRIDPGERMRVHTGKGQETRLEKHWGRTKGILGNDTDSVQLKTYSDITVASVEWPCSPCGPVADLRITGYNNGKTPADEWIDIKNRSGYPVDLRDWEFGDNVNRLDFPNSRTLAAGATLRIYVGHGTDTSTKLYWGLDGQILFTHDMLQLHTPNDDLVSCEAWGDKECQPIVAPTYCAGLPATVVGSNSGEQLFGSDGDDVILALGGDDLVTPFGGDDIVCGGDGRDTISFRTSPGGVTVDLAAAFASGEGSDSIYDVENIVGSAHADKLIGSDGRNVIDGGSGKDRLIGRGGRDTLKGGPGKDTLKGGGQSDVVRGMAGDDVMFGQSGNDDLVGGSGSDDSLDGGAGTDHCDPNGGVAVACET